MLDPCRGRVGCGSNAEAVLPGHVNFYSPAGYCDSGPECPAEFYLPTLIIDLVLSFVVSWIIMRIFRKLNKKRDKHSI